MKSVNKNQKKFVEIVRQSLLVHLKSIDWNNHKQLKNILIEVEELQYHLKNNMHIEV